MPTINESFTAGQTRRYNIRGGFFRLLETGNDEAINAKLYDSESGLEEYLNAVLPGIAVTMPFDFVEITSPTAQDVQFLLASSRVEYERKSVSVQNCIFDTAQAPTISHVTTGASAVSALAACAADETRYWVMFQNVGSVAIYIAPDASLTDGFSNGAEHKGIKLAGGESYLAANPICRLAWYAISTSASSLIVSSMEL